MNPPTSLQQIQHDFVEGLSQISRFWGFPRGMGAIFASLYLSPTPLSLDELVYRTGLTKGAISTEVRSLARMGLVYHRSGKPGDRRDYYEAETDFYRAIRQILQERQNTEFDCAIRSVHGALAQLKKSAPPAASPDYAEWKFTRERVEALSDFFEAIDSLASAVTRLEKLGLKNVQKILGVLK